MIDRGELLRKVALNVVRLSGLSAIAARFNVGVGAILMLHRVSDEPGRPYGFNRHLTITPAFLDAVLNETARLGFRFVSMDEAADRLTSARSTEKFIAITADDGYRDNLTVALPILERYGAPISIYVAPSLIDGSVDLWWDAIEEVVTVSDHIEFDTPGGRLALDCSTPGEKFRANTLIHNYLTTDVPEHLQGQVVRQLACSAGVDSGAPGRASLMTWDEVRAVASHPLVTIGAHTLNHYCLARLTADEVAEEMREGARALERQTGIAPRHFAYPYGYAGAVGQREVEIAREAGFVTAVTTRHGILRAEHRDHMHALPRISVNGRYQQVSHVRTMVTGITTAIANRGKALVTV
ncbi:MAG: polysaccharide deacetylase family protein [Mesorhizobium sp.]